MAQLPHCISCKLAPWQIHLENWKIHIVTRLSLNWSGATWYGNILPKLLVQYSACIFTLELYLIPYLGKVSRRDRVGFSFYCSWTTLWFFFSVGARVWACEWKAELSGSDSYRHGAEEADWEFIFWSQHAGASQPRRHAARHSRPSRSAQVLFLSPDWKVKFVLRSKKKVFELLLLFSDL